MKIKRRMFRTRLRLRQQDAPLARPFDNPARFKKKGRLSSVDVTVDLTQRSRYGVTHNKAFF